MRNLFFVLACSMMLFASCHESIEDRAEREARDYTRLMCPTPVQNDTRVDSMVFDRNTRTFVYYATISGEMDNKKVFDANKEQMDQNMRAAINNDTGIKTYRDAGIKVRYICRSQSNPKQILFEGIY